MRTVSPPLLAFLFNTITLQYSIVANAEHPLFHRQLFRRGGTVGVVSQKSVSQRPLIRRGITTDNNVDEVDADDSVQRALHGFDLSLSMPTTIASIGASMSTPMITSDAPAGEAGKYDNVPFSFSVSRTNMYISFVA
jgi:hypothetical protein